MNDCTSGWATFSSHGNMYSAISAHPQLEPWQAVNKVANTTRKPSEKANEMVPTFILIPLLLPLNVCQAVKLEDRHTE